MEVKEYTFLEVMSIIKEGDEFTETRPGIYTFKISMEDGAILITPYLQDERVVVKNHGLIFLPSTTFTKTN